MSSTAVVHLMAATSGLPVSRIANLQAKETVLDNRDTFLTGVEKLRFEYFSALAPNVLVYRGACRESVCQDVVP
jgi:hypothetical protein